MFIETLVLVGKNRKHDKITVNHKMKDSLQVQATEDSATEFDQRIVTWKNVVAFPKCLIRWKQGGNTVNSQWVLRHSLALTLHLYCFAHFYWNFRYKFTMWLEYKFN